MMRTAIFLFLLSLIASLSHAQTAGDYLILQDIDRYKLTKGIEIRGRIMGGEPTVERMGDEAQGYYTSYGTRYVGGAGYVVPDVEVRVYDSTQWALHELESRNKKEYSKKYKIVDGRTTDSCGIKLIDGYRVIWNGAGGGYYFWMSNNIAVIVKYIDLNLQYPEPLEVIKEYLKKYPSTLATYKMNETRDKEYIKEEFDRLLWGADRWVSLIQAEDPKREEKLVKAAKSLERFARYRQVYFNPLFGDPMEADIDLLESAHMGPNLESIVRTKLIKYKDWWAGHKTDSISLP